MAPGNFSIGIKLFIRNRHFNIQKSTKGPLPFCFYTNGLETFFWDLDNYPPRRVIGFPTIDDLERYLFIRKNRKPLTQELINTSISRYREMVEKRDLIQSPFTIIHPQGIRGVFSPGEINEILTLTEHLAA